MRAVVEVVDDPSFAAVSSERVVASVGADVPHAVVVVADRRTMVDPAKPLLVVDRADGTGVRCVPEALWALLNDTEFRGIGLAEMVEHVGADGLFRGVGGPQGLERRLAAMAALRRTGAAPATVRVPGRFPGAGGGSAAE